MGRPIRFNTKKEFKIVNKCIMCGRIIPMGYAICGSCDKKRKEALKRLLRGRR